MKSEYEKVFYITIPWRCKPLKVSQFELVHLWLFGPEVDFWAMQAKNNETMEGDGWLVRCRRVKKKKEQALPQGGDPFRFAG